MHLLYLVIRVNNRTLLSGWISEAIENHKQKNFGCIALPKIISLDSDSILNISPAPELANLRKEVIINEKKIISSQKDNFNLFKSNTFEVKLSFLKNNSKKVILNFCKNLEFDEYTSIIIDQKNLNFELNRSKSSLKAGSDLSLIETKISFTDLIIHMFVDISVIEVFLNYKKILTSRIYPNSDSKNFEIYSEGGNAEIDIQLWTMDNCK